MNPVSTPRQTVCPSRISIRPIIQNALDEDLGQGDVTTDAFPELARLIQTARLVVRQDCTLSGLSVAQEVFQTVDPELTWQTTVQDGAPVSALQTIATVKGSMASILKAERTALNFLQHLCGIATMTRRYVDAMEGNHRARLVHTRKTTPGLRILEQQAVLHGGGYPHRYNLGSAAMLKDNHLQALLCTQTKDIGKPLADGSQNALKQMSVIEYAVNQVSAILPHTAKIEVEVETLQQVQEALEAKADVILLDNMDLEDLRRAVSLVAGRAVLEASGCITLETIRTIAETGVDIVSTSKITLGVPAIDIGLDL